MVFYHIYYDKRPHGDKTYSRQALSSGTDLANIWIPSSFPRHMISGSQNEKKHLCYYIMLKNICAFENIFPSSRDLGISKHLLRFYSSVSHFIRKSLPLGLVHWCFLLLENKFLGKGWEFSRKSAVMYGGFTTGAQNCLEKNGFHVLF